MEKFNDSKKNVMVSLFRETIILIEHQLDCFSLGLHECQVYENNTQSVLEIKNRIISVIG